jgi:EmrB/QacA subfamily drug resistance transporter
VIQLSATLKQRLIVATIVLGSLMGSTDSSIVVITLPTISKFYNVGTSEASWVLIAYLLAITSFLIAFGRLGDIKSHKNVFAIGFALFTITSFLCGIAGSLPELILFRGLQGLGGAMIMATGPAILSFTVPEASRGRAFGYLSAANSLGLAAGFGLGGLITHFLSWQWIFFVNVPVGVIACILAVFVVPQDTVKKSVSGSGFDLAGAFLIFLSTGLFVFALSLGEELGWTSLPIIAAFLLSFLFAFIFLRHEQFTLHPLLDLALLRESGISIGIGAAMLNRFVVSGMVFLIPLYLELVKGYSTGFAGLLLLCPSLLILIAGPAAGSLSDRFGSRWLCTLAGILLLFSVLFFVIYDDTIPLIMIILALSFRAISMGLFAPPNLRLIFSHTPPDQRGAASGLWYFSRYLASTIGIVFFETLFDQWIRGDEPQGITGAIHLSHPVSELMIGFDHAFLVAVFFIVGMIVLTVLIRERGQGDD